MISPIQQPGTPKSPFSTSGQSINAGSLLAGLTKDSQFNANTGTKTGDRAAQDFAKSQLYASQADFGRNMALQNAKTNTERMAQGEQMAQQWSQAQMNRFQGLTRQRSQQSSLASKLLQDQIGMQNEWQTRLIGMMQ
jgi:hypothetical protein